MIRPRRAAAIAYALLLPAWALRLYHLGGPELWFDEAASYFIAAKPPAEIVGYASHAIFEHPPLYYLALHGFMGLFGASEWALRFPSVLFGLLLVAGLYRAGATVFGTRLALTAMLLAAASAFLVTYSQEARMYSLLQGLGLLATFLLYRAAGSGRRRLWAGYAAVMLLGLATHYFFAFLAIAHAAILLVAGRSRRRLAVYLAGGLAAAGLAVALWLASAPGLRAALAQVWRESLWGKSPEAIARLFLDWAYGGAVISARPAWAALPAALIALVGAAGLAYGALPRRHRLALALWVAVPAACAIAIPYGGLALRHFSYVIPGALALTAAGLLFLRDSGRLPAAAGAVAIAVAFLPGLVWQYGGEKSDYGRAFAAIEAGKRPGDVLLLLNPHQWVLAAYYNRTGLPIVYADSAAALQAPEAARAERLWLLEWQTWALPEAQAVHRALAAGHYAGRPEIETTALSLRLLYSPHPESMRRHEGARWDDGTVLSAVDVSAGAVVPGEAVLLDLAWEPRPGLESALVVVTRLLDDAGAVWAEEVAAPGADGALLPSRLALPLPGGTPPGDYTVTIGIIDPASGRNLTAFDAAGVAAGPWLPLGPVSVGRSGSAAALVRPQALPGGIAFLGAEGGGRPLRAGERWHGFLRFAAPESGGAAPYGLRVSLVGAGGEQPLAEVPLAAGWLPAEQWLPGEAWRCRYEFRLPPSLPAGTYRLVARSAGAPPPGSGLLDRLPFGRRDYVVLDEFEVSARQPHTVEERPSRPLDAVFAGQVALTGYDLERVGAEVVLRLYWQALAPTGEPHKVFVHLAAEGAAEPLDQDDAPPAAVATSDWLPGETYVSEHRLSAEGAGAPLFLRLGLYSERTMARLPAAGADARTDHVLLPLTQAP